MIPGLNLQLFIKQNKESPVYAGSWNYPKMTLLTLSLENGCVFNLTSEEVEYLNANNLHIDWGLKP